METTAQSQQGGFSFLCRPWLALFFEACEVMTRETDVEDVIDQRGRLIAQLEHKIEQAKKDIARARYAHRPASVSGRTARDIAG